MELRIEECMAKVIKVGGLRVKDCRVYECRHEESACSTEGPRMLN